MEQTPKQQFINQISKSKRILIVTHVHPDGDSIGSTLSLYLILKKLGKDVTAVCKDTIPKVYEFLPAIQDISKEFDGSKDFIISVSTTKTPAEKIKYHVEDNKLNIVVTPETGNFNSNDISFDYGKYNYDCIIALDSPDLDRLGALFTENTELFYNTPLINIDHHAGNEEFGQINVVDVTATSTSEILVSLAEALGQNLIDGNIATCLLAGIITDTNSFQNSNTTPKSFTVAAQLIAGGANQQEIIKQIFKTKPVSQLKLWGRVMTGIKYNSKACLAWSVVTQNDFKETKSHPAELQGVLDEFISTIPEANLFFMLSEREPNKINVTLRSGKDAPIDAITVANALGGGGHKNASGAVIENIKPEVAEKIVINKIAELLGLNEEIMVEPKQTEIVKEKVQSTFVESAKLQNLPVVSSELLLEKPKDSHESSHAKHEEKTHEVKKHVNHEAHKKPEVVKAEPEKKPEPEINKVNENVTANQNENSLKSETGADYSKIEEELEQKTDIPEDLKDSAKQIITRQQGVNLDDWLKKLKDKQ